MKFIVDVEGLDNKKVKVNDPVEEVKSDLQIGLGWHLGIIRVALVKVKSVDKLKETETTKRIKKLKDEINAKYGHAKYIHSEVIESIDKFFPEAK